MNGHETVVHLVPGQVLRIEIADHTPTAQVIPVETWQDWPAAGTEPEWYARGVSHVDRALGILDSLKEPPVPVYELPSWVYAYVGLVAGFAAIWWFT